MAEEQNEAKFYKAGFMFCMVAVVHIFVNQLLISKKQKIHPNLIMLVITGVVSIFEYNVYKDSQDLLTKGILPFLRFIIPCIVLNDTVTSGKKAFFKKPLPLL